MSSETQQIREALREIIGKARRIGKSDLRYSAPCGAGTMGLRRVRGEVVLDFAGKEWRFPDWPMYDEAEALLAAYVITSPELAEQLKAAATRPTPTRAPSYTPRPAYTPRDTGEPLAPLGEDHHEAMRQHYARLGLLYVDGYVRGVLPK